MSALAAQGGASLPTPVAPPLPVGESKPPLPNEPPPPAPSYSTLPPSQPALPNYNAAPVQSTYTQAVSYNTAPPAANNYSTAPPAVGNNYNTAPPGGNNFQPTGSGANNYNSGNPTSNYNSVAPPRQYNKGPSPKYNSRDGWDNSNSNNRQQNRQNQRNNPRFGGPNENMNQRKRNFEQEAQDMEAKRRGWLQNNQPQTQASPLQKPKSQSLEELTEAEKKFDKQFADWEAQFNKWKEQNVEHPDKEQYREYEKKWENWRAQLLERREQMRRKRLNLTTPSPNKLPLNETPAQSLNQNSPRFNQPSPVTQPAGKTGVLSTHISQILKVPPNLNNEPLIFKERKASFSEFVEDPETGDDFLKSADTGGGIPGLDLVKDGAKTDDLDGPEEKTGPDFDAISKGINNILGDQKLLNMLSMVSQNQNITTNDNLTTAISKIQESSNPETFPVNSNLSQEEYPPAENAPTQQREFINNFDDQTRSSFTMNFNEQERFEVPLGGRSQATNQFPNRFGGNLGQGGRFGGPEFEFDKSKFGPGTRDQFGTNQDKFAPPGPDRFGPNQSKFGHNQDKFGPNQEKFGPNRGNFQDQFAPNQDNFGGPRQDTFGPGPERFGPNQAKFGPNQDKFGPNQGNFGPQDRFGPRNDDFQGRFDSNQDTFAGNQDRFGPGPRFGSNQKFGPNMGEFDNHDQGPPEFGSRGGFNDRQQMGPRGSFGDEMGPRGSNAPKGPDRGEPNNRMSPRGEQVGPRGHQNDFVAPGNQMGPRVGPNNQMGYRGGSNEPMGPRRGANNQMGPVGGPNEFMGHRAGPQGGPGSQFGPNAPRGGGNNIPFGQKRDQFNRQGSFVENYDEYNNFDESNYDNEAAKFEETFPKEDWKDETPKEENEASPKKGDILEPVTVIDYDHKPMKPIDSEILLEPIYMFDYRHKTLSRIPLPQRPKWLLEALRNIREFDPPVVRPYEPPNLRRYPPMDDWRNNRYQEGPRPALNRRPFDNRPVERPQYDERRQGEKRSHDDHKNDWPPQYEEKKEQKRLFPADEQFYNENWGSFDEKRVAPQPKHDQEGTRDVSFESSKKSENKPSSTLIEDIINPPGRYSRPPRLVIILRGPPGSGKTYLAKLIKDKEVRKNKYFVIILANIMVLG